MSVLTFYGDESFGRRESGSQGCYVAAGYLAESAAWKALGSDWKKTLDASPRIDHFRMSECFAAIDGNIDEDKLGVFAGIAPREAQQKLEDLVSVLEGHGQTMASAHSITTWDIFEHAVPEWDKELFITSPFYMCFTGVFQCCLGIVKEILGGSTLPISFVFDERSDSEKISAVWKQLKSFENFPNAEEVSLVLKTMGSLTFSDDRLCIPLQCADLFAWHVRRDYISPAEDHSKMRPEYERLRKCVRWHCKHLENETSVREARREIWFEMLSTYLARKNK